MHLFFEFADHSHIAFFDLGDNGASAPDPDTPRWVNHFAMEVADEAALEAMRHRLSGHGIETVGPTDHHFIRSIYFFDPNGLRLEITVRLPMHDYVADKRRARRAGRLDPRQGRRPAARPKRHQQPGAPGRLTPCFVLHKEIP